MRNGANIMIMCIDMDAFFVSVEQASNPKLKHRPVAVIGAKDRTVITTSSYEARSMGVKTGMSKYEALKICPELIFVIGSNRKYTFVSGEIIKFFLNITSKVEAYSIDEAFLDISELELAAADISFLIKSHILKYFDITCSIGVGSNKFIAKMASGINKPDGYYYVDKRDVLGFIDSFELEDMWGIGKRTAMRLRNMGIFSAYDLRNCGKEYLIKIFGKYGDNLYKMGCGECKGKVETECNDVKSIGHSMTLPENTSNMKKCCSYILQLSEMVSARARKHKVAGKTVILSIRYDDMSSFSKRVTMPYFTSATHHLYDTALYILRSIKPDKEIRLLGIALSGLVHGYAVYSHVAEKQKWEDIYKSIDKINDKYGDCTVSFGSVLSCRRKGSNTIAPAWRHSGIRNINVR